MKYSYLAKNQDRDLIYNTRLKLFTKLKIDKFKSPALYSYFMNAYMGIILTQ